MAISYPVSTPTDIGIANITLRARNAVALTESPFSFKQQVIRHAGQRWEADVSIPPVRRDLVSPWVGMLMSLKGQFGTFLLGDPDYTSPRGSASAATISGSAGDESVTVSTAGTLLAGDYIQIGSGSSAKLHKILQDQSGDGTLEIWPALRVNHSGSVTLASPKGVFRLAGPVTEWSVDSTNIYGLSFSAVEVL